MPDIIFVFEVPADALRVSRYRRSIMTTVSGSMLMVLMFDLLDLCHLVQLFQV